MKRGPANESVQVPVVGRIRGFGDNTDGTVKTATNLLSRVLEAILYMTALKSRIGRMVSFTRVCLAA